MINITSIGFGAADLHVCIFCIFAVASTGLECVQTCRLIAINLSDLEAETRCPVCLGKCITVASDTHYSGCQLL